MNQVTRKNQVYNLAENSASSANSITIIKPTDCHIHLRDGVALQRTVIDAAKQFQQAIIMPNLDPPILDVQSAFAYQQRIIHSLISTQAMQSASLAATSANQLNLPTTQNLLWPSENFIFWPHMTLYLTDTTTRAQIIAAKQAGIIGVKLYPAGSTTNSQAGITKIKPLYPVLASLEQQQLPLLFHGEVNDPHIDIFDREKIFIEQILTEIINNFPGLPIVLEHITTQEAVDFIKAQSNRIAATITPHHLVLDRNDLLVGGIKPNHYCLPILKRKHHQQALIQAAISGDPKFFLGTDSAPHSVDNKHNACGCAGIYNCYSAVEIYAQVFAEQQALDKLSAFASLNGPKFYNIATTAETITLVQQPWQLPEQLEFAHSQLIPLFAGETLAWRMRHDPKS